MSFRYRFILLITILLINLLPLRVDAQKESYTADEALKIFNDGNYQAAQEAYDYLLSKYPRDAKYNFYMGICQVWNRSDVSSAIKKLNYARIKNVSRNVYYYLGKAHQLSFQFDEAIKNYALFIKYGSQKDDRIEEAKELIEQSKTSQRLSAKIYELTVLEKSISNKDSILEHYYPAKEVGRVLQNKDYFEAGVPMNNTLFETERGDVVYFTMPSSDEDTMSIFKMEKLIDGWGDNVALKAPVTTEYNEAYPFLETDGVTLYFASDRPGGFGGFDIYKTYFDVETQSYVEPVNLGVPFNSPADDYFFVADEFNGVAWFTSNRETSANQVMVYTVKWDGNQVRNMAESTNQIKEAAALRSIGNNDGDSHGGDDLTYSNNNKRNSVENEFEFDINDTIKYTRYDQFISQEALALFQQGYINQQKKDSLSVEMRNKRVDYAKTNSPEERNSLVNEILELENKVYSLDDIINEKNIRARRLEINEIVKQINAGTYQGGSETNLPSEESNMLAGVMIPEKYEYWVPEGMSKRNMKLTDMYSVVFSPEEIKDLKMADSLCVWAEVLKLEASQMLEQSTQVEEETSVKISQLLKNDEDEDEELKSTQMIQESKELEVLSAKLYHKSFDKKYPIYWLKLKDAKAQIPGDTGSDIYNLAAKSNSYFNEANQILETVGGVSLEEYKKAGSMKKAGIDSQEKALFRYQELIENGMVSEVEPVQTAPKGKVQKSYSELQKGEEAYKETKVPEKTPVQETLPKTEVASASEYRIQIGVFRNPPNANALSKIPPTTKIELEGRGLTKYYSGHFKTRAEAENALPEVETAGFPGAYIVYFENGKPAK